MLDDFSGGFNPVFFERLFLLRKSMGTKKVSSLIYSSLDRYANLDPPLLWSGDISGKITKFVLPQKRKKQKTENQSFCYKLKNLYISSKDVG